LHEPPGVLPSAEHASRVTLGVTSTKLRWRPPVYEQISYVVDDPIATITLNRPERLNAWTQRMGFEVRHALAAAVDDPSVVGIIVTGAGRAFCAGVDLHEINDLTGVERLFTELPPDELRARPADPRFGPDFLGQFSYILAVPKPVIAAINGPIAGMAVPIALACDLRFMAIEAVMTMAFSQRGLVAEWGLSWLLPRLVGPSVALDLLFSSRKVTGSEAAALSLVNAALPRAELIGHAESYIRRLADECAPTSLATIKRQVNRQLHAGLGLAEAETFQLMLDSLEHPDAREGIDSFLEKRAPRFQRVPQDPVALDRTT
jgi:enoyl-CoA hydratase/carnithine racemase